MTISIFSIAIIEKIQRKYIFYKKAEKSVKIFVKMGKIFQKGLEIIRKRW